MNAPAFVTSFTGKVLPSGESTSNGIPTTPRCAMAGDSKAPVITLKKTALERQNSISVAFEPISASYAAADAVASNTALAVTLQSKKMSFLPTTTQKTAVRPDGVSPVDFYYPTDTRNLAPNISLNTSDNSLSVNFQPVKAEVAGVASTSEKEVPFWKKPKAYKWVSTPSTTTPSSEPEVISTASFEKYFPSSIRNLAPLIKIKDPKDCAFNELPSVSVSTEFVQFNQKLNRLVVLPDPRSEADLEVDSSLAGAATVAKYFPADRMHTAPKIEIIPDSSVSMKMEAVEIGQQQIDSIFSQYK